MSPRIAYWTSSFEPDMEAIASEVALLRRHFRPSIAWGLSHRHWALLSWRRGFCLNPSLHLLFRGGTRILEGLFDIHHIYGSIGDWFYLQGVRRRPTVLTAAAWSLPTDLALLHSVTQFVVEHPAGIDELTRLGIERRKVRLIFPPVDLDRFTPHPAPQGPFTVLFASSPETVHWLISRGVPQILDAATLRPRMRFRLLWRPWGDSEHLVRRWIRERELVNVELVLGRQGDMASQYNQAHVTIAPFTDKERCKPAPNSLLESMACGRPVLVTESVGLAELVTTSRAGSVCKPSGEAIAAALDDLEQNWRQYSPEARTLAERFFARNRFLQDYQRLYHEIMTARGRPA